MRSAYSKHRKMNQLESCETNLSFKNILDVVNKAFLSFSSKAKNIHNSWYLLMKNKLNAYQFMKKRNIIFCHASLKEEQFCYFAYFATLRNTCCYMTLKKDVYLLSLERLLVFVREWMRWQVEHIKNIFFNEILLTWLER